jgi:hypothetical protein
MSACSELGEDDEEHTRVVQALLDAKPNEKLKNKVWVGGCFFLLFFIFF